MTDLALDVDVLIVGGGLAGLPLGLALAEAGLEVGVIDRMDPAAAQAAGFDGRVSSLAPASMVLFDQLGVDLRGHCQPIHDIVVADGRLGPGSGPSSLFLHFDPREVGQSALGQMIENRHIRQALSAAGAGCAKLQMLAPAELASFEVAGPGVVATLADGRAVKARLCVAADGARSALRAQAGIQTVGWDYGQVGLVACVAHERPHAGVAQEYFLPSGPFASLPMMDDPEGSSGASSLGPHRSSLVWTVRAEEVPALLGLDEAAFNVEMRRRFGDRLGACEVVGPRWSYPLKLQLAREYVAPRLALVGDAAHVVHPLAGQGLNLGLRDVAALGEVIIDAARLGRDIGAPDVLASYQRWRRFDNVAFALACDGLNRLFSNDAGPVRGLRDLGLGLVNQFGPARRMFMHLAGGQSGRLPRLLKGEPL